MTIDRAHDGPGTRARLLHALALNRSVRLNFPGVFMGLYGRQTGSREIALEFDDDDLFRDARGDVNWAALGVLVDVALGSVTRLAAGPTMRPATVQLTVQMTGASTRGHLVTHARFVGDCCGAALPQTLTAATITCGEETVAHATGAFVLLALPKGETQVVLPWIPEGVEAPPLVPGELEKEERQALERCERAQAAASAKHPFIDHFWCGIPTVEDGKARLSIEVTPHLGNRVAHVHGGVLLGAAASVASAAVPARMRLSNISSWFVSPGLPPRLEVRAEVLQHGRNLAVVRTQILSASGKLVLETTSQHIASATARKA